jgi:hypothetical protein
MALISSPLACAAEISGFTSSSSSTVSLMSTADLPSSVFLMEAQPPKPSGMGTGSPLMVTFRSLRGSAVVCTACASL